MKRFVSGLAPRLILPLQGEVAGPQGLTEGGYPTPLARPVRVGPPLQGRDQAASSRGGGERAGAFLAFAVGLLLPLAASAQNLAAEPARPPVQLDRLQRADGASVVPEQFLRRWDPITVFFEADTGPASGGPEDDPGRVVTMTPPAAGSWQWLNARTLQFRPAEPWRALQRVEIAAAGKTTRLVPLLPAPTATSPEPNADGIPELDQFGLTFSEPVDVEALRRLLSVELRPLPGISGERGQVLGSGDVEIKTVERAKRSDEASYLVRLRQPVPDGRLAILRLRLSDEPGLDDPSFELALRSAVPFVVSDLSCTQGFSRNLRDGINQCAPNDYGSEDGDSRAGSKRGFTLDFTAEPETPDAVRARGAFRITPPVDDLAVERDGSRLKVTGRFRADTIYDLRVEPGSLKDGRGRPLTGEAFRTKISFMPERPRLRWDAAQGIAERFGPQMIPLRGRGYDRADIRIHAVDPLARHFWPFPTDGLETSDDDTPPLAGNEAGPWTDRGDIGSGGMTDRIRSLGSPAISEIVRLPTQRGGVEAKFGLDLKAQFARIAGPEQPGTYLVGLRPTDGSKRRWIRVQVTDLVLTSVEEAERVRFAVTSLSSARPVGEADIRLEGLRNDRFVTIARGRTDADGGFVWSLATRQKGEVKRIVVQKGLDTLVLEPTRGPAEYRDENWTKPEEPWLAWSVNPDEKRAEAARTLCHVFTERPIYRPEEPVHIKGMVRRYLGGALAFGQKGGTVIVNGPGDGEWKYPVSLDQVGGFYHKFDVTTEATGDYSVRFQPDGEEETCGEFPFKKEAYRLPTFEVLLNGPREVPLDGEFSVDLLAKYFAGGLVAERPIKWRVTQFPQVWNPPGREGFLFSSDSRFSGEGKFRSTPVLEREAKTDPGGSARLTLDPTIEPTAQPRRYSVEATVTGDDDIQVRSIQNVVALPPFTLGVKIPRYLPQAGAIEPEILAVKADGTPLSGLGMTVRLIRRNWSSVLQASDFSQGSAKYVTQVIDETLVERKVTSAAEAQKLSFEAREAGVYLVQAEASDRIGRRQIVSVDFFMGGNTPVTWSRPPADTVTVSTEKEEYAPGETATLVVQSPFQNARALAVVEEPEGRFQYDWVDIQNGFGRYQLTLRKQQMPKLAVHFLVMRGRLPGEQNPTAPFDLTKPTTVAATKWVKVASTKNIVVASLEAPARARPAEEVEVTLRLADDTGRPISGEAVFWMVDQAVLSLARERPLDPLPSFIVNRPTKMAARDTRNMAFGIIPLDENPGGDEAVNDWGIENISVRKNFTPIPIYLPRVSVGEDGIAKIKVKLPDTLTVFKLRAKAISGPDRFGFATGEMLIRQELVAQPALPRFVRPGDRFDAGLIGRVVEGLAGTGRVAITAEGAVLDGPAERPLAWERNLPARADFPLTIGEPKPGEERARLRFVLQRDADKAGDAVQIDLPVRPDRPPVRRREVSEIAPGRAADLAPPTGAVRQGSYSRSVTVANDPVVVRLIGGMTYLVEYPYGCTEQRIATASAGLALKPFLPILQASGLGDRLSDSVRSAQRAIQAAIDEDGLVAFWPRAKGNVSLTAWAYRFLVAAEKAGESVDKTLLDRLSKVLKLALRSDYPRLLRDNELRERVEALTALAEGGLVDEAYATELARRADAMPSLAVAEATYAVAKLPGEDRRLQESLVDTLWSRVRILNRDGRPVYAGIAGESASPVILPSETRTLAEMVRATAVAASEDSRNAVLRDGLIRLGEGNGWGSTNANAAAIRALAETWRAANASVPVTLSRPSGSERVTLGGSTPLVRRVSTEPGAQRVENNGGRPVVALVDTRYQPVEPGYLAKPAASGFVLTRSFSKVPGGGAPIERLVADNDNAIRLKVGDVVEEVAELVNGEDRTHVAIRLPLAAGLEPLNPNLATAPAEAVPSAGPTLQPTYVGFYDDHVLYAYESLPKGNYRFTFRTRALIPGTFTSPPGEAETMYQAGIYGASAGARVVIGR